jgi:hypothetical protein
MFFVSHPEYAKLELMKTALLLDFDETIFRTGDYWVDCRKFWAENHSAETTAKIENHQKNRGKKSTAFAPKQFMSDEEWLIAKDFCDENAQQFLHADFVEFLEKINLEKFATIILTFGEKDYQAAKLDPLKLDLSTIFLDHSDKTGEIAGFWREDHYEILGESFSGIILIDDRDFSFSGFEKLPNARGFFMKRENLVREFDARSLANNVQVVKSFREIVLE